MLTFYWQEWSEKKSIANYKKIMAIAFWEKVGDKADCINFSASSIAFLEKSVTLLDKQLQLQHFDERSFTYVRFE